MGMIMTYKIIHKLVDICFSDLFSYSNSATQSNNYKKQSCYSNIRLQSFSQRVVNDWNSLPADIVMYKM